MKVYISGAITNNPNYKEQFEAAEDKLKAAGYEVINPAYNQGYSYKEYIDHGLFQLMHCDAIYLLKGYEQSTGATLDHDYARTVGLKIIRETDANELTYGDIYRKFIDMFPEVYKGVVEYRPAETPYAIHIWLKDGRELAFTYTMAGRWSMETYEHYKLLNNIET